jgi:hypothetical protein
MESMMKYFLKIIVCSAILVTSALAGQGQNKSVSENEEPPKKYRVVVEDGGYGKYLQGLEKDIQKLKKALKVQQYHYLLNLNNSFIYILSHDLRLDWDSEIKLTLNEINSEQFSIELRNAKTLSKPIKIEHSNGYTLYYNDPPLLKCFLFPNPFSDLIDPNVTCLKILIKGKEMDGVFYPIGELVPVMSKDK